MQPKSIAYVLELASTGYFFLLAGLLREPLEKLPDYATGNPKLDPAILKEILVKKGYGPIYFDLTREDTDIPVVRSIVPGLEIMAAFDEFSRVSQRLFLNYLHLFTQKE